MSVVTQDVEDADPVEVVTNAKHVSEGQLVVLALPGAIVPAGSETEADGGQGIVVSKQAVGGVQSSGMLCDGAMLSWKGGSTGVLVTLNDVEEVCGVGSVPPVRKPRKE